MKLSVLISTAVLMFTCLTHAKPLNLTGGLHPVTMMRTEMSLDDELLKPVKNIKAKIGIFKTYLQKQTDGTYKPAQVTICASETTVPVYDARNTQNNIDTSTLTPFGCAATFKGIGPAYVYGMGLEVFNNVDIWSGDQKDQKFFAGGLAVVAQDGKTVRFGDFSIAVSDDVNASGLSLLSSIPNISQDGPYEDIINESVHAFIKFEE